MNLGSFVNIASTLSLYYEMKLHVKSELIDSHPAIIAYSGIRALWMSGWQDDSGPSLSLCPLRLANMLASLRKLQPDGL